MSSRKGKAESPNPQQRLEHLDAVLRAIRSVNQLIVREKDADRLAGEACRLLVETRGYHSAWLARLDEDGNLRLVAESGLGDAARSFADRLRGGNLVQCARIALGAAGVQVVRDPLEQCPDCPVSHGRDGWSCMTVRLEHQDTVFGLLGLSGPGECAEDDEEIGLVRELANDIAYALSSIRDAELHELAVEQLRQGEALTRSLLETSPSAIVVVDNHGAIVSVNAEAERVLGLAKELITQRTYNDPAWHIVDYEGRPFPDEQLPVSRVLREGRAVNGVEHAIEWPTGERVLLSVNAAPLPSLSGEITRVVCTIEDVTERRRTEAALRKSEQTFRRLFESMMSGFVLHEAILDAAGKPVDFRFLQVNPAFERVSGLKPSDVVGRTLFEVSPGSGPFWLETYGRVAASGEPVEFESYSRRLGKQLKIVAYSPGPGEVAVVFEDITERKQMEQRLRESEEYYRELFEQSKDCLFVHGPDGQNMIVNQAWLDLFGYSRDELQDLRAVDVYANPQERADFLRRIAETGLVEDEVRFKKKDGTVMDCVRSVVAHKDEHGNVVAYQGVIRDITARKKAELALEAERNKVRGYLHVTGSLIVVLDVDGRVGLINRRGCEILGHPEDEILGKPWFDSFLPARMRKNVRTVFDSLMAGETEPVEYFENPVVTSSGEERLIAWHNTVLRESGKIVGAISSGEDITERREEEQALRESEDKFRSLFEQSLDAINTCAPDGSGLEANQAWLDLFGYSRDELADLNAVDIYASPEDRKDFLRRMAETGVVEDQISCRKKDGTLIDCRRAVVARKDEHGNVFAFQGVIHDITEDRRRKDALADELARRRILLEQSRDGIVVLDQDGRAVEANQSFARMLGYSPEELLQLHVWDWDASFPPETLVGMIRTVDESGDHFETRHRRKDGTVYDVEISTNGAVFAGRKLIFCVCRDITEQKRAQEELRSSEERYRLLVQNQMDLIVKVDTAGRFEFVSPSYCRMFGKTENELLGRTFMPLVHPDDRDATARAMEDLYHPPYSALVEQRAMTRDGWRWLGWVETAVLDADSNVVSIIGVGRDITARKEAEQALHESRDELRRLATRVEEAREDERTSLSRELHDTAGQAITALKLDVSQLKKQLEQGQAPTPQELDALNDLLDQTADDVRRISSELRPGVLDDIGLEGAVEWQIDELRKRTALGFTVSLPSEESQLDYARRTALFRVFQELLTNAVRHAAARSVRVTLERVDNMCTLTVADDGCGVDLEKLEASSSIGIIGMRERLRPYGGELHYDSMPGKGTTARVVMPVV
jgi:PAS domain S-box-containing protein